MGVAQNAPHQRRAHNRASKGRKEAKDKEDQRGVRSDGGVVVSAGASGNIGSTDVSSPPSTRPDVDPSTYRSAVPNFPGACRKSRPGDLPARVSDGTSR